MTYILCIISRILSELYIIIITMRIVIADATFRFTTAAYYVHFEDCQIHKIRIMNLK